MPAPIDPPAHPGQVFQVGFNFEPGIYETAGAADGFTIYDGTVLNENFAFWYIYTCTGENRESSFDHAYRIKLSYDAYQAVVVINGTGDDTLVLHWGARTAFLPWNISPADMQNNIDVLIYGISPIPDPVPGPFDPPVDDTIPNNCTVTGIAGQSYFITYTGGLANSTPSPGITLEFQRSSGSIGSATISDVTPAVEGGGSQRNPTQVCIRNSDFVFGSYGFQPWTKVHTGVKDVYIRTQTGWTPASRLPHNTHVKSYRPYAIDHPLWMRNELAHGKGSNYMNVNTLHANSGEYWLDIGDFKFTDGIQTQGAGFWIQPQDPAPVLFPTTWPTTSGGASGQPLGGLLSPGAFTSTGVTMTSDNSDPALLAAAETDSYYYQLLDAGSTWASSWNQSPTDGSFHRDRQRTYQYGSVMMDHDWVIWVRDKLCQAGAQAYHFIDVLAHAYLSIRDAAGSSTETDLHGYQLHIRNTVPAAVEDRSTFADVDGTLPFTSLFNSGVYDTSDRAAVPLEGDTVYTSLAFPGGSGSGTWNRQFYILPFTPVAGEITGLYFTTDVIPDGLVTDPDLPESHAASVYAYIQPSLTFAQPGEPIADWRCVQWMKNGPPPTGPSDWRLVPVTVLP